MADTPVRPIQNDNDARPAAILIIDQESESANLHRALKNDPPNFHFDMYSSFDQAESRVGERYQALIINVQIAGLQHFSLLRTNHFDQSRTPFLVTARIHEKGLAQRALQHGALGCIMKPITDGVAASTVRRAISLSKLWTTMALTQQMLERYKEYRPGRSIDSCQRSIEAIETSLRLLKGMAHDQEQQARYQAVEQLNALKL